MRPRWSRFLLGQRDRDRYDRAALPILRSDVGPIALLRPDGDYYASTRVCLDLLFARVAPGGCVIIDDYATYRGCRRAVDEFLATPPSVPPLHRIDEHAVYFETP
jgi:O-methyltransferase